MRKQIIFIWGWIAKENYLSFADYVEKIEYNPYEQERKKWTDFFAEKLWSDYEFIKIPMPNKYFAPALNDSEEEINWSFEIKSSLKNFEEKYSSRTYFLHSKDDFVVPFSDFLEFKNIFPKSNFIEFENKNHFLDLEFVEFEDLIKQKF